MFSFAKRHKLLETELFEGFVDLHSHILPGVDDGAQSVESSLRMLQWYEELGVSRVILTPHIMEDYPANTAGSLRAKFAEFQQLYGGSIELHIAAEYMLDSMFDRHLDGGDMLTLWDNYLLVESSYIAAPVNFFDTLKRIISKGYFVVLAHPERYLSLSEGDYARLRDMGVLFQLNLLSVMGGYGEGVKRRAESLLKSSSFDLLGTDIHSLTFHSKLLKSARVRDNHLKSLKMLASKNR